VVRSAFAALLGTVVLVFTGTAASATSYADAEGDANTPADIVSVGAADGPGRTIVVTVDVANYRTLPLSTSFSVWFDVDASPGTGNAEGREARVRYESSGAIGLELWSGTRLIDQPPTGISGSFADGRFTLSVPRGTVGVEGAYGVYVVSARGQPAGTGEFVASDAAPDSGNYQGPANVRFSDPAGDHQSAPDIAAIEVSELQDGWVDFAISIPNSVALPRVPVVGLSIDVDDDLATGDSGADLVVTARGADAVVDRWSERSRTWLPDVDEPMVRAEVAGTVARLGVHRSELGAGSRFGFAVLAAGLAADTGFTGVDVTPDGARFFRYVLEARSEVTLVAGKLRANPARPVRGSRFNVVTTVSRSDGVAVRSGSVRCAVKASGKRLVAMGLYQSGRASCSFTVPKRAKRVTGSMTIRADGVSSTVPFSYRVR
jgi:hypothetical protein